MTVDEHVIRLVPLRVGTKPIGVLAAAGRPVEAGTLDTLAGVVAIAIERAHFLEERKAGELTRQSERAQDRAPGIAGARPANPADRDPHRRQQPPGVRARARRAPRAERSHPVGGRAPDPAVPEPPRDGPNRRGRDRHRARGGRTRPRSSRRPAIRWSTCSMGTGWTSPSSPTCPCGSDPRLTATALAHLARECRPVLATGLDRRTSTRPCGKRGLVITVRDRGSRDRAGRSATPVRAVLSRRRRANAHARAPAWACAIVRGLLAVESGRVWAENGAGRRCAVHDGRAGHGEGHRTSGIPTT